MQLIDDARTELRRLAEEDPHTPLGIHAREVRSKTFRKLIRKLDRAIEAEVAALWPELPALQRQETVRYEEDLAVEIHKIVYGEGKTPTPMQIRHSVEHILGPGPYAGAQEGGS